MERDRLRRAELAIDRAGDEERSVVNLCRRLNQVVAEVAPSDRWCSFAVDPATLFPTNGYHDEGVPFENVPRLLEIEHGETDCNLLPALARTGSGVNTIHQVTGNEPARSTRWREVLEPSGLRHELRAVLRDRRREGGRTWGALVLLRSDDSRPFTTEEMSGVAALSPSMARAMRRALIRQQLDNEDDVREAGIVVVGSAPPRIKAATPAALEWLGQLDDAGFAGLPTCATTAIHACRANAHVPAVVRARTRSGRWLTITAERLAGGSGSADPSPPDEIGLIIQPSRPAEIAGILGAAHRLTSRESEVAVLVAAGQTNRQIAHALAVSPHTVDDHLKKVFAKLDVASRGEMTSKLYRDHYQPREMHGTLAGMDGWYLPDREG